METITQRLVKATHAYHRALASKREILTKRKELLTAILEIPTYLRKNSMIIDLLRNIGIPEDLIKETSP